MKLYLIAKEVLRNVLFCFVKPFHGSSRGRLLGGVRPKKKRNYNFFKKNEAGEKQLNRQQKNITEDVATGNVGSVPRDVICTRFPYSALTNYGSTCYINATLQMLYLVPTEKIDLKEDAVSRRFNDLLLNKYNKNAMNTILYNAIQELWKCREPDFLRGRQGDARDFIDRIFKSSFSEFRVKSFNNKFGCTCERAWHIHPQRPGLINHHMLNNVTEVSWEDVFTSVEVYDGRLRCDDCGNEIIGGHNTTEIEMHSEFVIVNFILAAQDDNGSDIKLKPQFNLTERVLNNNETYEVKSIVFHSGNGLKSAGGHYYTCSNINSSWYKLSDSSINLMPEREVSENTSPRSKYKLEIARACAVSLG